MTGKYWGNIPDYLSGQAKNKVLHILKMIDFEKLLAGRTEKLFTIVDIGCGAGKVSTGLANTLRAQFPDFRFTVHGFDFSPDAIEYARKENPDEKFTCGNFSDSEEKWDLGILCDIVEHVENPNDFLESVSRQCKSFIIGYAMDDNLANKIDKKRRNRAIDSGHINLFNEKSAINSANKQGEIAKTLYISNPVSRTLRAHTLRGVLTLPLRLILLGFSRRIKGKIFGGESIYVYVKSRYFD